MATPEIETTGELNQPPVQQVSDEPEAHGYGKRPDGSEKDVGFLGELKRPDGNISTEVSIGVEVDGQEMEIPSLVPGLTQEEQDAILNGEMPESAVDKAVAHARQRIAEGKSPFYSSSEASTQQTPEGEKLSSNPWEMSWGDQPDYGPEPTGQQETAPVGKFPWEMEWGNRYEIEEPTGAPDSPQSTYIAPTNVEGFEGVFANLIQAESRGRHTNSRGQLTTSPVGARGITQIMPATGRNPGYGIKPLQNESQEEYLRVGREYLQAMLRQFNGNYAYAVAAYNAGEGNVKRAIARAERAGSSDWISFLPRPQETGPYVRKILGS